MVTLVVSAPERAAGDGPHAGGWTGAVRASERAARCAGDDRVGHARRQREIRVTRRPGRDARGVTRDRPQRPTRLRADLGESPGLQRPLELLALRRPRRGRGVRERGERVRDTGQLPGAGDPRAGLLAGRVGRVLAPLAERG